MAEMTRTSNEYETIHATCLALTCAGKQAGVLLLGGSGSGKSSLALRLLDEPGFGARSDELIRARLVADDQVIVRNHGGGLVASAPRNIGSLLEVYGHGILKLPDDNPANVVLAFAATHVPRDGVERLPEPVQMSVAGQSLRLHELDFGSPAAPAIIRSLLLVTWGHLAFLEG